MKYQGALILLVALFAAGQAAAQELSLGTTISKATTTTTRKQTIHWLAPANTEKAADYRRSVGGLSPQAWTTQVGWNTGVSAFPDDKTCGSGMCLLWIGHKPWRHATLPVIRQ